MSRRSYYRWLKEEAWTRLPAESIRALQPYQGKDGQLVVKPVIQSDNGSGYISREFLVVLAENGLGHHRIKPHCPEENGVIERAYRT